jgi:hypothetical protein
MEPFLFRRGKIMLVFEIYSGKQGKRGCFNEIFVNKKRLVVLLFPTFAHIK